MRDRKLPVAWQLDGESGVSAVGRDVVCLVPIGAKARGQTW